MSKQLGWASPHLRYVHADARYFDFGDATHAFVSSTCYSEDLITRILNRARAAPDLKCVIVHNPGHYEYLYDAWGPPVADAPAAATWADFTTSAYVYQRELPRGKRRHGRGNVTARLLEARESLLQASAMSV